MRFLSMIRVDETSGKVPSEQLMNDMGRLIEELTREGTLVRTAGLRPTAEGARVRLNGGSLSVIDGPFTEAKELVGGYWLIDVKSKEEAVEWASRAPINEGDVIEVRQVFEMEDHGPEVQAAWDEHAHP